MTKDEFRLARIAEGQQRIEEANRLLMEAKNFVSVWEKMSHEEVSMHFKENITRIEFENERLEKNSHLNRLHKKAMQDARENRKGILYPHAADKLMTFGAMGALIGWLLLTHSMSSLFGIQNNYALCAIAFVGCLAGFLAGVIFFHCNFVIDKSLELPLFQFFEASKN